MHWPTGLVREFKFRFIGSNDEAFAKLLSVHSSERSFEFLPSNGLQAFSNKLSARGTPSGEPIPVGIGLPSLIKQPRPYRMDER